MITDLDEVQVILPADVGDGVTDDDVLMAELVISTKAGLVLDEDFTIDDLSRADRFWFKRSVAFQAAWLRGHPDLLIRMNSLLMESDGDTLKIEDDGLLIAPLARWALMRTSTFGSRSVMTATPLQQRIASGETDAFEVGWHPWR